MWLWIIGAVMTGGGVVLARLAFRDEAFLAPVLGWAFVGVAMLGAALLAYRAATAGIVA
ncbi:hypothetical protein [Rhodovibrio sodomensis]|uniref:hypothetical protein n=1 Tax=Rhodovibrio sodomensis TaxID=1088 RepID=UPI0019031B02|nr:hypothetical protein [Rhodovibrio sodomensis]